MDTSLGVALGLGFLLGIRHALDADHLAAVSTLISQHRSLVRSCLLGAFWGAGHTVALLAAGTLVIVFKLSISPAVERGLELAAAILLVGLGGHVLLGALGALRLHRHAHAHAGEPHTHLHVHWPGEASHDHGHLVRLGRRPFLVGLLHGLAGSAALTLLVLTTLPSAVAGLVYLLVFGIGSTAGMLVSSGLLGIPFAMAAGRSRTAYVVIQALAGAASVVLGAVLAWNIGRA